jgi:hypothetical protein
MAAPLRRTFGDRMVFEYNEEEENIYFFFFLFLNEGSVPLTRFNEC